MKKRCLAALFTMMFLLSALPAGATADILSENGFEYAVLDDGTARIFNYTRRESDMVIPAAIAGHPVTQTDFFRTPYQKNIRSITIPESVTSLGSYGFQLFDNLAYIEVDANNPAFSSRDGVLFDKAGTTLINYPYQKPDTAYTIPEGVTTIGEKALQFCNHLLSVTIPGSVKTIGDRAFRNCTGLASVTFSEGLTTLGTYAFSTCISLTSLSLPDSLTVIGHCAFATCTGLVSVTIPPNVTTIGALAFTACENLVSVFIPASVRLFATVGVFTDCPKLAHIDVAADSPYLVSRDDVLYDKAGTTLFQYPMTKSDASYVIPDGVTLIATAAFAGCESLVSVTIPDSVSRIADKAFFGCTSLVSVTLPTRLYQIEDFVFGDCTALTSIIIPDRVSHIDDGAFRNCTALTSVTIPRRVSGIGVEAFKNCPLLTISGCDGSHAQEHAQRFAIPFQIVELPEVSIPIGDANADDEVDTADAVLTLQYTAELIYYVHIDAAVADVNGDGRIDTADAVLILQYAAGLIDRFPTT